MTVSPTMSRTPTAGNAPVQPEVPAWPAWIARLKASVLMAMTEVSAELYRLLGCR